MSFKNIAVCLTLGMLLFTASAAQAAMMTTSSTTPTDTLVEAPVRKLQSERVRIAPLPAAPLSTLSGENKLEAAVENTVLGSSIVKDALAYMGTRYRSGGTSPAGFDCSGFTSYIYRKNNVPILRDSRSQYTQGTPINSIADLRAGDLVFFGGRSGRGIGHVGIVTEVNADRGSFKFIHSSSSQGVTITNSSDAYYNRRYVGARRII